MREPRHCPACGVVLDKEDPDRPISELFRLAAEEWAEAEGLAAALEELKTAKFETMKTDLMKEVGNIPENRAERLVKSSREWKQYIREMCQARDLARKHLVQVQYYRMKHSEWIGKDANARAERRM